LPDREMSRRLGVSTHFLYKWMQPFAEPASKAGCMAAELAAALPWLLLFWFWQAMDG
jgi:transposase-like protein